MAAPAAKSITKLEVEVESRNKGNFNVPLRSEATVLLAYDSDGLVREERVERSRPAPIYSRQTSACGLLVGAREMTVDSRGMGVGTTAVPSGAGAAPVQAAGVSLEHRFALVSAAVERSACSPQPNQQFVAKMVARGQKKMIGSVLSFNRFSDLSVVLACEAGSERIPASGADSRLSGSYLKVSCKSEGAVGHLPGSSEYAFLSDYGIYLPLVVRPTDSQTDTYKYRSVSSN